MVLPSVHTETTFFVHKEGAFSKHFPKRMHLKMSFSFHVIVWTVKTEIIKTDEACLVM